MNGDKVTIVFCIADKRAVFFYYCFYELSFPYR
jgi:hypothetical protein